jgi:hypothetical protein
MTIYPVQWDAQGKPTLYRSGAVYTTVNGNRMWVSDGYEGKTIADVCKQAVGNALVRHMAASLVRKMTMKV